jgi:TniQ
MTNQIKPLLITPEPKPTESLMGLILRTSEENGYTSPTQILRYAGLTENEIRSVNPPLDKLAQLYARKPEDFSVFGIDQQAPKKRVKKWRIFNHVIPGLYVNVKSTKICPECIKEKGMVDGFGELKFALVCSKHQRELIDTCPRCKKKIKWRRMELLKCVCGHDLSSIRGNIMEDQSILNITELIHWKLNNHNYDETSLIAAGYPLIHLRKISLATLLGIIERLQGGRQRKTLFENDFGEGAKHSALKRASRLMSNWPNGFYDFLEKLSPDNRHIGSRNLQSQYQRIYMSFFRTNLPAEEVKFIRSAFVTFANDRLGEDAYIDVRLSKHAETSRRYVGVYGLAAHLKVQMPTIRNYVEKEYLKPETRESMGKIRKVFDLHNLPFKAREGNYFKQREAANFLNLNVSTLRNLKKNGIYKIKRLGWGVSGYSELDLIEFKESFIKKAPDIIEYLPEEQISIEDFFRKKSLAEETASKIFGGILDGHLIPIGRIGNEISDIVFTKQQLSNYLRM